MFKLITTISIFYLLNSSNKHYIIVIGDFTCKSCVTSLYNIINLQKKNKHKLSIGLEDKKNIFLNTSTTIYYKKEIGNPKFIFISNNYFSKNLKYPYLLVVKGTDTIIKSYESIFKGDDIDLKIN